MAFVKDVVDGEPIRPAGRARVYVAPSPTPEARPMTRRAIREAAAAADAVRRSPRSETVRPAADAQPTARRMPHTVAETQTARPQAAQARSASSLRRAEVARAQLVAVTSNDTPEATPPTAITPSRPAPLVFTPARGVPAPGPGLASQPTAAAQPGAPAPSFELPSHAQAPITRPAPTVRKAPAAAPAPARVSPFVPVRATVAPPLAPAPLASLSPAVEVRPHAEPQTGEPIAAVVPIGVPRRTTPPVTTRRTAQAAAKRGRRALPRVASLPRRTFAGTAAAVALVALTTTTVAVTVNQPGTQPPKAMSKADNAGTGASSGGGAATTARTRVPQATLTAASDELVRADFVTQNASATIDAATLEKIKEVRGKLNTAVSASTPSPLDGRDTDTASRSDTRTAPSDSASSPADANEDPPTTGTSQATEQQASADAAASDDASGLTTLASNKASAAAQKEIESLTAQLKALVDSTGSAVTVDKTNDPDIPATTDLTAEQLDQWAASTKGYENGKLPQSVLCGLSFAPGAQLRCDAAHQLEELNTAFKAKFGHDLTISDSYRSYADQVAVKRVKGRLAGTPGTSNHGWGVAVDIGQLNGYSTAEYKWMRANAPAYGWDNPPWARPGGTKNEPWHWQYMNEN